MPPDGRARRPLGSPHVGGDHAVTAWPSAGDSVELDNGADDEGPQLVHEGDRLAVLARRHAHPLAERGVEGADRVSDDRNCSGSRTCSMRLRTQWGKR